MLGYGHIYDKIYLPDAKQKGMIMMQLRFTDTSSKVKHMPSTVDGNKAEKLGKGDDDFYVDIA